jgi:hypothetical protein
MIGILGPVLGKLGGELIDNLFETEEEKANAKAKLVNLDLKRYEIQMSAIVAEAKSADPWTSRARPSFLYIIYLVIILCFVGGIVGIWWPEHVGMAAANISDLLAAIPESLWALFGAGYLGYSGARSYDKRQVLKNKD